MPENTPSYQDRVSSLRKEISGAGLDGYIIPRTDEFQGEFLADYAQRLAWISGFTGSAGSTVILPEEAVVMSDGRYTLQLREEVDTSLFYLEDSTKTSVGEWLDAHASEGSVIGYDVWLYTPKQIETIEKHCADKNITLKPHPQNLIDAIWFDQPDRPNNPKDTFPDDVAGLSSIQKRNAMLQQMHEKGVQACVITVSDSICWLLNIRGSDVEYSPLCLSYVVLYEDGVLEWFVNPYRVTNKITKTVGGDIRVFGLDALEGRLNQLTDEKPVWIDRNSVPEWFERTLKSSGVDIIDCDDPCIKPKAIKTTSEQDAIRKAHIQDGVSVTKFLKWVDENQNKIRMDELSVEEKLEQIRSEQSDYFSPSFPTIAGFADNGAVVHYRANENTNKEIKGDGLLLVDSGGQYRWGTTDITRTCAIGTPSQEMRENYTRVLRGHIAVALAVFSKDTTGIEIDALARRALHEVGLDFAHGTGHGVGCNLCVHEAGTSISPREEKTFESGMLISNEPGYYEEGEYGIRIENLVLVQEGEKSGHYCFDTVSLAPLDPKLIVSEMLDEAEKEWLSEYLGKVKDRLQDYLDTEENAWLDEQIKDSI